MADVESPQYARALRLIADGNADPVAAALMAVAEAVKSLAFQQETANLLAYSALFDDCPEVDQAIEGRMEIGEYVELARAAKS